MALGKWKTNKPLVGQAAHAAELFAYRAALPESLIDAEQKTGTQADDSGEQAQAVLDQERELTDAERAALEFINGVSPSDSRRPIRTRDPLWNNPTSEVGAMTYEDVLPLVYLAIKPEHQRALRARNAIERYYTLDRNPDLTKRYGDYGFQAEQQGIYYYYFIVAKTLKTFRMPTIRTAAGQNKDWVRELVAQAGEAAATGRRMGERERQLVGERARARDHVRDVDARALPRHAGCADAALSGDSVTRRRA